MLGWQELLLIMLIVLVVFGGRKLPSIGENLGKAIKGFKSSVASEEPPAQDGQPSPPSDQAKNGQRPPS